MGQHAEDILNGDVDQFTGEWIGDSEGFPRTSIGSRRMKDHQPKKFAKSTKAIRKELAILIKKTIKNNPEKNESVIVNECRAAMNTKYGKGWREQYVSE